MNGLLEKTMRLNYLFDFYQALLTQKQREYMRMYYLEDFSLIEIARISNVSRQAVYDNIKRTETILKSYEEKLLLYEKFKQRRKLLTKLEEWILNEEHIKAKKILKQLKELS